MPNAPEAGEMDVLIQRGVESGIIQFYKRMESFLAHLKKPFDGGQQDQFDSITMHHIWIYVYGFLIANGLCALIFLGEILYFHWKKILACLRQGAVVTMKTMRRIITGLHQIIQTMCRFLGRGVFAMQRIFHRHKHFLIQTKMWRWLSNRIPGPMRLVRMRKNWQTKVHPFPQGN